MSTLITTQGRRSPVILDASFDSGASSFLTSVRDFFAEIGYCISLSAQAISFSTQTAKVDSYSASRANRLDNWPVDLWVF